MGKEYPIKVSHSTWINIQHDAHVLLLTAPSRCADVNFSCQRLDNTYLSVQTQMQTLCDQFASHLFLTRLLHTQCLLSRCFFYTCSLKVCFQGLYSIH